MWGGWGLDPRWATPAPSPHLPWAGGLEEASCVLCSLAGSLPPPPRQTARGHPSPSLGPPPPAVNSQVLTECP